MEFRIADTFTESLARLAVDEQKAAKTTAFDLQVNPAQPGLQFHRLDRARDRSFWSVRVDRDLRAIVHRSDGALLLCYVGHHDDAYRWAERRRIETHPTTGAAQLVEIRETIREVVVPHYVDGVRGTAMADPPAAPLFADVPEGDLLRYGVPAEWIAEVLAVDEDGLFALAPHLPAEAAEALLELATGGTPAVPIHVPAGSDPFSHPDAQRRFRLTTNADELRRALEFPWARWSVFLHPAQRDIVERRYSGPARVAGSAGTGKTVVALHRAAHLARSQPRSRVLLTTFSPTLAAALAGKLDCLVAGEPATRERIIVRAIDEVGIAVCEAARGRPLHVAGEHDVAALIASASATASPHRWSSRFLETDCGSRI